MLFTVASRILFSNLLAKIIIEIRISLNLASLALQYSGIAAWNIYQTISQV